MQGNSYILKTSLEFCEVIVVTMLHNMRLMLG